VDGATGSHAGVSPVLHLIIVQDNYLHFNMVAEVLVTPTVLTGDRGVWLARITAATREPAGVK